LGTAAVSKDRTEIYIKEVNKTFLASQGLKFSIASSEALRAILQIPQDEPSMAPLTSETMSVSTVERAMPAARLYSSPLELHVLPPASQTTTLVKLSAKQGVVVEEE
jgi:hypothetical protein